MDGLVNGGFISFENHLGSRWPRALPEVVEYAGVKFFIEDSWNSDTRVSRTDIPSEFYAHELLDVKTHVEVDSEKGKVIVSEADVIESVTDFVSRWGLVYDPARYGSVRQFTK